MTALRALYVRWRLRGQRRRAHKLYEERGLEMNGLQHFHKAEQLLDEVEAAMAAGHSGDFDQTIRRAQVHATLAAASASNGVYGTLEPSRFSS